MRNGIDSHHTVLFGHTILISQMVPEIENVSFGLTNHLLRIPRLTQVPERVQQLW